MNKIILIVGICFKPLNLDPWVSPIYRIHDIGKNSILVEQAIKNTYGWEFLGDKTLYPEYTDYSKYEVIECPNINWNK